MRLAEDKMPNVTQRLFKVWLLACLSQVLVVETYVHTGKAWNKLTEALCIFWQCYSQSSILILAVSSVWWSELVCAAQFIKLQLFKRSSLCGIGLPWSSALKSNQRISIWWGEEKSVWNWRREKFWDVVSMAVWKPPRISTNGIFHFYYFWGERIFRDIE